MAARGTGRGAPAGAGRLADRGRFGSATSGSASLRLDPGARPATSLPSSGNAWAADPGWDWTPVPAADGLGFQTAPFTSDTTIAGPATLDLWVASASPVVDLQATITEVRPAADQEEYVTSGFLRSSNQVDLPVLHPAVHPAELPGSEARYLTSKDYSLVGSPSTRSSTPSGPAPSSGWCCRPPGATDRPGSSTRWTTAARRPVVRYGGADASELVVNVVGGVQATPMLPACGSLRGEPCRTYQPEGNQS